MRFITEDSGAPKSAGPGAIATFATIVNRALYCSRAKVKVSLLDRKDACDQPSPTRIEKVSLFFYDTA